MDRKGQLEQNEPHFDSSGFLGLIFGILLFSLTLSSSTPAAANEAPHEIVTRCFKYMRGSASVSKVTMVVHRPDWERTMEMDAWTVGESDSMIRITAPAKDKGNGTLKKGTKMWTFNPKVNRVINLPPSMMSQAWMGSDFSNNDLAKSDSIINDYDHTITDITMQNGRKVYLIESVPKPGAPVVWGLQKLKVREDGLLLSQIFFDEDLAPVKVMTTHQIEMIDDRLFPRVWRMRKVDTQKKDEFTQLYYRELEFKQNLPASIFTLSNLKRFRR
jgi:outer membrane lipoprotein-sorting protein